LQPWQVSSAEVDYAVRKCLSFCPSALPSATLLYFVKTAKYIVKILYRLVAPSFLSERKCVRKECVVIQKLQNAYATSRGLLTICGVSTYILWTRFIVSWTIVHIVFKETINSYWKYKISS